MGLSNIKMANVGRLRVRRGAYIAFVFAAAVGIGAFLLRETPAAPAPPPAPAVIVATPLVRDVKQWDEYVGRFSASKSVAVRPRVSGAIVAIHFRDGEMVVARQLLFTIDPRPYLAALSEARAGASSAASALELARSDVARASRLLGDDAVSASEADALRGRLRAAEAQAAAAKARMQARALDVEFTQVRAPIGGKISDRRIDVGNLVVGGEGTAATLLTTINSLDPIYFTFDASEALYLKSKRRGAEATETVEIRLQDETSYRWKGVLDFTDNEIDARSGTIRGRATIANPQLLLTPGMFGNMRMASGSGPALLVPDTVVQADQAEKAVLIVGPKDMVAVRTVTLGPSVQGLRVITAGLEASDRVIIGGQLSAVPGALVRPQRGEITASPDVLAASSTPSAAAATFPGN
jgi:multidrug efflux system membrane fusion protein